MVSSTDLYIRPAALFVAHIRPVCSLVAPCQPGAAPPSVYSSIELTTLALATRFVFVVRHEPIEQLAERPEPIKRLVDGLWPGFCSRIDLGGTGWLRSLVERREGHRLAKNSTRPVERGGAGAPSPRVP